MVEDRKQEQPEHARFTRVEKSMFRDELLHLIKPENALTKGGYETFKGFIEAADPVLLEYTLNKSGNHNSPFMMAIRLSDERFAEALVDHGVKMGVREGKGRFNLYERCVHLAARAKEDPEKLARIDRGTAYLLLHATDGVHGNLRKKFPVRKSLYDALEQHMTESALAWLDVNFNLNVPLTWKGQTSLSAYSA